MTSTRSGRPADRLTVKLKAAAGIPSEIRAAMGRAPEAMEPGAIDVIERFFNALRSHRAPRDCPPRACFDAAAASESTLATLLRALERVAPEMNLSEGRAARKAWYRRRTPKTGRGHPAARARPTGPPAAWPAAWHEAHARLFAESPKESTARRHVSSLNRCAEELSARGIEAVPDRFRALLLGEAFAAQGLSPRTVRNYLHAFLRLAQCLDATDETRDGISNVCDIWTARACRAVKRKDLKLDAFAEAGGGWHDLLGQAAALCLEVEADPGSWRADAERARRQAVVLIVALNTLARTGDMARWRLGQDMKRREEGGWSLRWRCAKTGKSMKFSRLWPATEAALDALLLGGRPDRMLDDRYAALRGMNWLRHGPAPVPARYPSGLVKEVAGLSAHPLRTLAADALRSLEPGQSPDLISSWLGHRDPRSREEYAVAARGRAQADTWGALRVRIADRNRGNGPPRPEDG